MEVVVLLLKAYVIFTALVMGAYTIRHLVFTWSRIRGDQRIYYQDLMDSDLPMVTVLIPMHNEELVARNILDRLQQVDYPRHRLEIIPINDHSSDRTAEIIDGFAKDHVNVRPMHRNEGPRGKPSALNDALAVARGEIVIIFDADYLPPRGILRDIAVSFSDPEVGAVMGRVIPENTKNGLLTRLLDLERSGGYQVDQQARHNLMLIPQYGGTVGGFRRELVMDMGGFDPNILTEDTELTFKLYLSGYKVAYANRVECYEEVPEDWGVRGRQVMRWAQGHCQVMYRYLLPTLRSPDLRPSVKIDGILLLLIYAVPFFLLMGILCSIALFFLGEMNLFSSIFVFFTVIVYSTFGNFAPFYEIASAVLLDGGTSRVLLVPYLAFTFLFNLIYVSLGFIKATFGLLTGRQFSWKKTERFRRKEAGA